MNLRELNNEQLAAELIAAKVDVRMADYRLKEVSGEVEERARLTVVYQAYSAMPDEAKAALRGSKREFIENDVLEAQKLGVQP